jgi:L-alanine-DL-glutamate epimerase-like enolase superfamily enzyme
MSTKLGGSALPIEHIAVSAYTVPTDFPESDGTLKWDKTTLVVVEATADGQRGLGYTYADLATAQLINDRLALVVQGRDAMAVAGAWAAMVHEIRNLGRPGIVSMGIAAVDAALWDLKARLLDLPLPNATRSGSEEDQPPSRKGSVLCQRYPRRMSPTARAISCPQPSMLRGWPPNCA